MKKSKIISLLLSLVMIVSILSGCSNSKSQDTSKNESSSKKYSIVCTTFSQYDWVRQIIGNKSDLFDITLLLDKGTDLHTYQPTAEDINKIISSDMFIYVGGESDGWVDDALKESTNKNMHVVNMMKSLDKSVKEEKVVEGMQAEEEEEDGEGDEVEYDEHVWLSLRNAQKLVDIIADNLIKINSENKDTYEKNKEAYNKELSKLDKEYKKTVKNAKRKTVVFGDRFPFRYLVDDYNISYYAAFVGCSAETEASFKTVTFLAKKVDKIKTPAILVIENSNDKIANTIKDNTKDKNQKILVMNSLQSITEKNIKDGATYLSAMKDNLKVLKEALN